MDNTGNLGISMIQCAIITCKFTENRKTGKN